MKIIHKKKKKKSLRCNFLPLNKSIKSTLFFFSPTLICRPQGKVFSAVR